MKNSRFKKDLSKKKHGFSTFLRGCNPDCPDRYQDSQLNQSTIFNAKIKTFFAEPKILLLLEKKSFVIETKGAVYYKPDIGR